MAVNHLKTKPERRYSVKGLGYVWSFKLATLVDCLGLVLSDPISSEGVSTLRCNLTFHDFCALQWFLWLVEEQLPPSWSNLVIKWPWKGLEQTCIGSASLNAVPWSYWSLSRHLTQESCVTDEERCQWKFKDLCGLAQVAEPWPECKLGLGSIHIA